MLEEIQNFVQENLYVVIGVVVVIIAAVVVYFMFFRKDTDNQLPNNNIPPSTTEDFTEGKVLNYYGGKQCPHSNIKSIMYNIIFNKLKNKYPDLNINLYWGDERKEKFVENKVQFVPTILNNENVKVETKLNQDINTDDYSDEELEVMFLENIYNQL